MQLIDVYLWNEQTNIVHALMPQVEEDYPDIFLWFEIRQGEELFRLKGASVVSMWGHSWLGIPAGRDCLGYLDSLGLMS